MELAHEVRCRSPEPAPGALAELLAPHTYIASLSAVEAMSWLGSRLAAVPARLRVALGSDPGPSADVSARLAAARLAALQGRPAEAQAHMARVENCRRELELPRQRVAAGRAEVHLAAGRPQAAYEAAITGAASPAHRRRCGVADAAGVRRELADLILGSSWNTGRGPRERCGAALTGAHDWASIGGTRDVGAVRGADALGLSESPRPAVGWPRSGGRGSRWTTARNGNARTQGRATRLVLAWEETYACWRAAELLAHVRESATQLIDGGGSISSRFRPRRRAVGRADSAL